MFSKLIERNHYNSIRTTNTFVGKDLDRYDNLLTKVDWWHHRNSQPITRKLKRDWDQSGHSQYFPHRYLTSIHCGMYKLVLQLVCTEWTSQKTRTNDMAVCIDVYKVLRNQISDLLKLYNCSLARIEWSKIHFSWRDLFPDCNFKEGCGIKACKQYSRRAVDRFPEVVQSRMEETIDTKSTK